MTMPAAVFPYTLQFDVVSVSVNSGGIQTGDPGQKIHTLALSGADGQKLMFSFAARNVEVSVQKQDQTFYVIECPLAEHAPTLANLLAILPRPVQVLVVEAQNGVTSWQFTGDLL